MKVIHLVSGLRGGGAEQLMLDLCQQSQTGNDVIMEVVSLSGISDIRHKFQQSGIAVSPEFPSHSSSRMAQAFRAIGYCLRTTHDCIHAHMYYGAIAAAIVKLFRPKTQVIFTLHNSFQPGFLRQLLLFLTIPLRSADVIFPNTTPPWYLRKNAVTIANGIENEKFSLNRKNETGLFTFLFAGRLEPQKDPLSLVEIAMHLKVNHSFKIVVAGTGSLHAQLMDLIQQNRLEAYFEFSGFVEDPRRLYSGADCLLLPSRWEGMPLVMLEAAAVGIPIICTSPAARSFQEAKEFLFIGPPASFPGLMEKVMSDYPDALHKASKCRESLSGYTSRRCYLAYRSLYRSLMDNFRG